MLRGGSEPVRARRRGAATAAREGGAAHTLACAAVPTEWPKAAKRLACPGGTSPLAAGSCRLRPGGPSTHSGPSGLRLLRMTGDGWSAIFRRRRRRDLVGGWDTASKRGTASPSSRGPRGGVLRGGAAAAGGAASRAAAEGARAVPRRAVAKPRPGRRKAADASVAFAEPTSRAAVGALGAIRDRAEEALTSWSCRRRRRSEARPEGRRRRDPYISEKAGSPYLREHVLGRTGPPGHAAVAQPRPDAREGPGARSRALGTRPSGREAAKRPACPGGRRTACLQHHPQQLVAHRASSLTSQSHRGSTRPPAGHPLYSCDGAAPPGGA